MKNVGLVLQGGGNRGIYTAGVLDFFLDKGLNFPYVIGVSAGSCNGATYVAKQRGLGKIIHAKYIKDSRYMGLSSLVKNGCYFNMDFIFEEIPRNLEGFDYEAFKRAEEDFWVVATNCHTGTPQYYSKKDCKDIFKAIRASCSLPFLAQKVKMAETELLDGGIVDPIPVVKSVKDGNYKNVIILTEDLQIKKPRRGLSWLAKRRYSNHHNLCKALEQKHLVHNQAVTTVRKLQYENRAFIIKPSRKIKIDALGRDIEKLTQLYDLGYLDASAAHDRLAGWLEPGVSIKNLN